MSSGQDAVVDRVAPSVDPRWFALHIHLSDPVLIARFMHEWMGPQVRELQRAGEISGWFYLNYWDGGPHLRVRVRDLSPQGRQAWQDRVTAAVPAWCAPTPPTREAFYGAHGFDGQPVDAARLAWFDEGTVRVVGYEPEVQRYGGPQALALAEQLFEQTSQLSCALLGASAGHLARRLAQALKLMPLYASALVGPRPEALAAFFGHYADFWAAYSAGTRALAAALAQGQPAAPVDALRASLMGAPDGLDGVSTRLQAALQRYVADLRRLFATGQLVSPFDGRMVEQPALLEASLAAILSSQMHMHNNRLGLVPGQELMLARQAAAAARALGGEGARSRHPELVS